jgi:hypothetical protein
MKEKTEIHEALEVSHAPAPSRACPRAGAGASEPRYGRACQASKRWVSRRSGSIGTYAIHIDVDRDLFVRARLLSFEHGVGGRLT